MPPPLRDTLSEAKLTACHPELVRRVRNAGQSLALNGEYFRIAQALRSFSQQAEDYAKGRTVGGKIVTNARAGYSWHQFGMAVDCYPFLHGAAGELDWNASDLRFQHMVAVLEQSGLAWGGEWRSIQDPPHFQLRELPVTPTDADRAAYGRGGLSAVWANYEHQFGIAHVDLHASVDPVAVSIAWHSASSMFHMVAGGVATVFSRRFRSEVRHAWRRAHHHVGRARAVLTRKSKL